MYTSFLIAGAGRRSQRSVRNLKTLAMEMLWPGTARFRTKAVLLNVMALLLAEVMAVLLDCCPQD